MRRTTAAKKQRRPRAKASSGKLDEEYLGWQEKEKGQCEKKKLEGDKDPPPLLAKASGEEERTTRAYWLKPVACESAT